MVQRVLSWNGNKGEVTSPGHVSTVNIAVQGHTMSFSALALHSSVIFFFISSSSSGEPHLRPTGMLLIRTAGQGARRAAFRGRWGSPALLPPFVSAAEHQELLLEQVVESGGKRHWSWVVQSGWAGLGHALFGDARQGVMSVL